MTREELIEKEGEKYSEEKWKHPSSNLSRAHCSLDYMAGINSQLNKDLQELAVIDALIKNNEGILLFDIQEETKQMIRVVILTHKKMKEQLLNKLNLE